MFPVILWIKRNNFIYKMSEPTVIDKMFVDIYIWYARVGQSIQGGILTEENWPAFPRLLFRLILFLIMLCLVVTHLAIAIITLNMGARFSKVFVFFQTFRSFNDTTYSEWRNELFGGMSAEEAANQGHGQVGQEFTGR
tara:strand:- start:570 stop:983 length:414 start_codon:yes stop_codon:yes gene_type:complete